MLPSCDCVENSAALASKCHPRPTPSFSRPTQTTLPCDRSVALSLAVLIYDRTRRGSQTIFSNWKITPDTHTQSCMTPIVTGNSASCHTLIISSARDAMPRPRILAYTSASSHLSQGPSCDHPPTSRPHETGPSFITETSRDSDYS